METYDKTRGMDPYERLACAIVRQAALDWKNSKYDMAFYKQKSTAWERERCNLYILERWFMSEWCSVLTYGNGEMLLEKLKKGEL